MYKKFIQVIVINKNVFGLLKLQIAFKTKTNAIQKNEVKLKGHPRK